MISWLHHPQSLSSSQLGANLTADELLAMQMRSRRLEFLQAADNPGKMANKEIFWMTCDSVEQQRAEYGPFQTRAEAEAEAQKLGFGYLLRYEHVIDENDDIQEVRCIFIELPRSRPKAALANSWGQVRESKYHTRCATCGEMAVHDQPWRAEVWADIHEFERRRHRVRLFEQSQGAGLREIGDWRDRCR